MKERNIKRLFAYLLVMLLTATMMPTFSPIVFADEAESVLEQTSEETDETIDVNRETQETDAGKIEEKDQQEQSASSHMGKGEAKASPRAVRLTEPIWNGNQQVDSAASLQAAINAAAGAVEIQLTQDVVLNGTQIDIPADKIIKLTSAGSSMYKIDAEQKSRVIVNNGTLYLDDYSYWRHCRLSGRRCLESQFSDVNHGKRSDYCKYINWEICFCT